MAEALRLHPLADRRMAIGGISLQPCQAAERVNLRAKADALSAIQSAVGLALPVKPKTSATANGITALWLGPDEWLLIAPVETGLAGKLAAVEGHVISAVDISHRNTAIAVEGELASSALACGCPQDLSDAAFPVGACSRTILGKSEIVLWRESDTGYRVECWRSFSDYVWKYLADAARVGAR
jgi:sarcosine oxidase subunit gamma